MVKLFTTDDGSLPEIELSNLTADEVIHGYEFVRNHSARIVTIAPYFWSVGKQCEVAIKYEDNPAIQVVSGEAEPFHLCFDGIKSPSGKRIPVLGIYVFPNALCFDYRMGSQWNQKSVQALFEFMSSISVNHRNMKISHQLNIHDWDGSIFKSHWVAFLKS